MPFRHLSLFPGVLAVACLAASTAAAESGPPPKAPTTTRAARDTWTPIMDVLKPGRTPVTDAQLARLKALPIEAVWGAVQRRNDRPDPCVNRAAALGLAGFLALGIDLIWGYSGILSLGQAVWFGLGGYAMAMYLKLEASGDSIRAISPMASAMRWSWG